MYLSPTQKVCYSIGDPYQSLSVVFISLVGPKFFCQINLPCYNYSAGSILPPNSMAHFLFENYSSLMDDEAGSSKAVSEERDSGDSNNLKAESKIPLVCMVHSFDCLSYW